MIFTSLNCDLNYKTALSQQQLMVIEVGVLPQSANEGEILVAISEDKLVTFDGDLPQAIKSFKINNIHAQFYWTTKQAIANATTSIAQKDVRLAVADSKDLQADVRTALLSAPRNNFPSRCPSVSEVISGIGTFIEAELGAFSWPSLIAFIIRRCDQNSTLTPEQNALATTLVWQAMALPELGLQYLLNVPRANGDKDPIIAEVEGEGDAPLATTAITLSVVSQVLGGITAMLAIDLAAADWELFGYIVLGLIVGAIQALAFLMSDAQTLWLSFMASKPEHERIKHITSQPGLRRIFANAEIIARIGRELYSPMLAGLGSYYFYCLGQITATELALTEEHKEDLANFTYCLMPFVYQGSAAVHRKFDVANMIKGLAAINILIEKMPYLMRSERNKFIRYLGYVLYGEAMSNAIIKLCNLTCKSKNTGPKVASNVELFFHAITTYAQTYRELLAYIANPDLDSIEQKKGGLLLSLYVQNPQRELGIADWLVHVLKVLALKVTITHANTRHTTILRETRTQEDLNPTPAPTPAHGAAAYNGALSPTAYLPPAQRAAGESTHTIRIGFPAQSVVRAIPTHAGPAPEKGVGGFSGPRTPKTIDAGTPLMSLSTPKIT